MYKGTRDWHLLHTFNAHGTDKQGQGKFPVPTLLTLFPTLPGKQEPARRSNYLTLFLYISTVYGLRCPKVTGNLYCFLQPPQYNTEYSWFLSCGPWYGPCSAAFILHA